MPWCVDLFSTVGKSVLRRFKEYTISCLNKGPNSKHFLGLQHFGRLLALTGNFSVSPTALGNLK